MRHTKIYKIASKAVAVNYSDGLASSLLEKELSLYKTIDSSSDFTININKESDKFETVAQNPSIHEELRDGFRCNFEQAIVTWRKRDGKLHVDLTFDKNKKNWKRKIKSIQYTHFYEDIGQVFHELVLIPTLFFLKELTLIHGSALEDEKKEAIIIGGTGGVGKTSLALSLVLEKGYKFLSDDISVLDKDGNLWPNFAFPKIYGYNVIDNPGLERKLLQNRNILDRIQWYKKKNDSLSRVRRRVNPRVFFNGQLSNGAKLSKIFILFRRQCKDFSVENIESKWAAEINIEIMKSEYIAFIRHLYWHKVNNVAMRKKTIIDAEHVLSNWYRLQTQIFNDCSCYLVKIPMGSKVEKLQKWFLSVL